MLDAGAQASRRSAPDPEHDGSAGAEEAAPGRRNHPRRVKRRSRPAWRAASGGRFWQAQNTHLRKTGIALRLGHENRSSAFRRRGCSIRRWCFLGSVPAGSGCCGFGEQQTTRLGSGRPASLRSSASSILFVITVRLEIVSTESGPFTLSPSVAGKGRVRGFPCLCGNATLLTIRLRLGTRFGSS